MHRADNLTTVMCPLSEIWESQPPGTFRACPGLSWNCFTFNCYFMTPPQSTATPCSLSDDACSIFKIIPCHRTAAATAETAAAIVATVATAVAQLHSTAVECS